MHAFNNWAIHFNHLTECNLYLDMDLTNIL